MQILMIKLQLLFFFFLSDSKMSCQRIMHKPTSLTKHHICSYSDWKCPCSVVSNGHNDPLFSPLECSRRCAGPHHLQIIQNRKKKKEQSEPKLKLYVLNNTEAKVRHI